MCRRSAWCAGLSSPRRQLKVTCSTTELAAWAASIVVSAGRERHQFFRLRVAPAELQSAPVRAHSGNAGLAPIGRKRAQRGLVPVWDVQRRLGVRVPLLRAHAVVALYRAPACSETVETGAHNGIDAPPTRWRRPYCATRAETPLSLRQPHFLAHRDRSSCRRVT